MDLFNSEPAETFNLLPYDGIVHYYGTLFPVLQANDYLAHLLENIEWKHDETVLYGKRIITKRKVAWYGDAPFEYTYSSITKKALPWTGALLQLKNITEERCGEQFNSCLLNLYHNGTEGMSWHSDAEKEMKKEGAIASLSFGAARKFSFRHKGTRETISLTLQHGSLLLMKGTTQSNWMHQLPPARRILSPRINLTFRTIVPVSA